MINIVRTFFYILIVSCSFLAGYFISEKTNRITKINFEITGDTDKISQKIEKDNKNVYIDTEASTSGKIRTIIKREQFIYKHSLSSFFKISSEPEILLFYSYRIMGNVSLSGGFSRKFESGKYGLLAGISYHF